jgi:hypothetical protein
MFARITQRTPAPEAVAHNSADVQASRLTEAAHHVPGITISSCRNANTLRGIRLSSFLRLQVVATT